MSAPGTVTIVCAPAGSGKTVLVRAWAQELDEPVAWATVERGERDAQHFWRRLIDALADVAGGEVIERVSPAPSFAGAAVVERLLTQLRQLDEPLVLVIDDLHELESNDALAWLEMLLTRLPPQLRVVLATREDPALGLHRLRLAGELTELRGSDLRFSLEETRALLRGSGIALSDAGVASLHGRTEGWPAGLRLAAISLSAHSDPERFVSEFSGSERTVARYLLAEVLERQPPEVLELLLRTSILERVSGQLADVLTGGTGGEAILQRLEDQNAFVTALDAGRTWFRYHHLFADLLRLELRRTAPATIASLHRAAASWYEHQGHVVEAIGHYQQAADWAMAGRLLVDNYLALTMAGRGQTLHAFLGMLPVDAQLNDGEIACAFAVDSIFHGLLEEAAALAEPRTARAPLETPDRPRDADLDDPRHGSRAGRPSARTGRTVARRVERRRTAGGQVPTEQPDRLRNRIGTDRLCQHRAHAHAPHLREARRSHTQRGCRSGARTRASRTSSGTSLGLRARPGQLHPQLDPITSRLQLAPQPQLVTRGNFDPAAGHGQLERATGRGRVGDVDQPLGRLLA